MDNQRILPLLDIGGLHSLWRSCRSRIRSNTIQGEQKSKPDADNLSNPPTPTLAQMNWQCNSHCPPYIRVQLCKQGWSAHKASRIRTIYLVKEERHPMANATAARRAVFAVPKSYYGPMRTFIALFRLMNQWLKYLVDNRGLFQQYIDPWKANEGRAQRTRKWLCSILTRPSGG